MNIIKEYCQNVNMCVVRSNTYNKHLDHIQNLITEAKKDFPDLKDSDIEIVKYGGSYYAKTMGIEFTPTSGVPLEYSAIPNLEYTS